MSAGGLRRFLFGSLRRQLVLGIAAVHAVLMTVFVADLVLQQRDMLEARQVDEARTLARSLALSSSAWLLSRDLAGLGELLDVKRSSESVEYAMLTDADGRILAHTERQRIGQYLADLPAVPAGADAGVRVLVAAWRWSMCLPRCVPASAMWAGYGWGWGRPTPPSA